MDVSPRNYVTTENEFVNHRDLYDMIVKFHGSDESGFGTKRERRKYRNDSAEIFRQSTENQRAKKIKVLYLSGLNMMAAKSTAKKLTNTTAHKTVYTKVVYMLGFGSSIWLTLPEKSNGTFLINYDVTNRKLDL